MDIEHGSYVDGVGVFLTVAADAGREYVTGSVSFELEELRRKTGWRWVWRPVRTSVMAPADSMMEWMRKVGFTPRKELIGLAQIGQDRHSEWDNAVIVQDHTVFGIPNWIRYIN